MDKKFYLDVINFLNSSPWKDDSSFDEILRASESAFVDIVSLNITKNKTIYRLCGQSGSGKTTQLMASIKSVLNEKNHFPLVVAVRNFVKYHPHYVEYSKLFPAGELREKTNGFALKCLFVTLCKLIENGYEIIYDVTVLEPKYEEFLMQVLKKNRYLQIYNILSVTKVQSTKFILKRQQDKNNKEFGRVIYKTSADYFYDNLSAGLKYLIENKTDATAVVWNAYNKKPIFYGKLIDCFESFEKHRKKTRQLKYGECDLLCNKISFYKKIIN